MFFIKNLFYFIFLFASSFFIVNLFLFYIFHSFLPHWFSMISTPPRVHRCQPLPTCWGPATLLQSLLCQDSHFFLIFIFERGEGGRGIFFCHLAGSWPACCLVWPPLVPLKKSRHKTWCLGPKWLQEWEKKTPANEKMKKKLGKKCEKSVNF